MAVNDDIAVADVEALLRRTLERKAADIATPHRARLGSGPARRPPDPRLGWAAAAACAIVVAGAAGLVYRSADDGAAPAAPATTPTTPSTTTAAAAAPNLGPDPDGPHTGYGTIRVSGGASTVSEESLTLVGGDVDTSFRPAGGQGTSVRPNTHNRRVDGVLYVFLPRPDGTFVWTYDPDDVTTISGHPTGHTPFELYEDVAGTAGFERVGSTEIDGIPVRQLQASTPEAVDVALLQLGGNAGVVESLDIWVTEANVVLRVEATLDGDPPTVVTVEFSDVGDSGIELDAPEGATELDAEG